MKRLLIFLLVMLALISGVNAFVKEDLSAYWTFDNTLNDATTNLNHLTNNGSTYTATSIINGSYTFDGTNDQVYRTYQNWNFANNFSFSFWFNSDVATISNRNLLDIRPSTGTANYIFIQGANTDELRFGLYKSDGSGSFKDYSTSSSNFAVSTWYFITITWDGTNLILYKNGVSQSLTKTIDLTGNLTDTSRKIIIGSEPSSNFWFGKIDEFGLWNKTLSSTEITNLYNSGNGLSFYTFNSTGVITPILNFTNISLVNNTYFNISSIQVNTSVLNTSTNGNVNQTIYIYNSSNSLINTTQYATDNLNGSVNLTLSDGRYYLTFRAFNNETNVTIGNYTITIDTTTPTINNNILNEYNYYTNNNLNSSCSDTNLLSCNISMNGQNVLLNTTSFNFTTNGNQTYNITAIDLAGNRLTTTGVTLVNPTQYFYFSNGSSTITNFTFGGISFTNYGYFSTYNSILTLGSNTLVFEKLGYATTNITFTINTTSNYNLTTNITQSKIVVNIYDRESGSYITSGTSLVSLVATTGYNTTTTTGQVNITNINFINEEYQLLVSNTNYYSENIYFQYTNQEILIVNIYLIALNSTDVGYVTIKALNYGDEALINGAYCYALEWKPTPSAFVAVATGKTNVNGETILNIELASKLYKFSCSKDGTIVYTDSQLIQLTGTIIPVIMGSSTINLIPQFNNLQVNLTNTSLNATHERIRFTWNDGDGLASQGCIRVYHSHLSTWELNDTQCVLSSNSVIVYDLDVNNSYNIKVNAYLNYQSTTLDIDSIIFKGLNSLEKILKTYNLDIVLPLVLFVLCFSIGLMLQPQVLLISFVGGIIGIWFGVALVPSIVSLTLALFVSVIMGVLIWATWRPK